MGSTRTKVVILVALVAVWASVAYLRPPPEPPIRSEPAQAGGRATPAPRGVPRLKTDLVNVPRAPYPSEVQNIFGSPPAPPPPAQSTSPMEGPTAAPAAPPPDPFQEEANQLRYVGFLQTGSAATAFLVRGPEVYTVPVGELVAGRFRVMEVRDDSVLLASPTGDKEVRLSLSGETGAPPRLPGPPRAGK
ncbi:MAG: hypothetical protein EHM71_01210 [Zetaproteobacteria bacterium]|nr:MAG: hypothetical protein EHM71_01210 [Zetaproteobacteria bacterium]